MTTTAPPASDLMTATEARRYLRMGNNTFLALAAAGAIPGYRVGRGWRFSRRLLDEWAADRCRSGEPVPVAPRGDTRCTTTT